MNITKSLIATNAGGVNEVWSRGEGLLARTFSLVYMGDLISIYLAVLKGIDPTPVKAIDYLKAELAKREARP
jgi:glucose/mannose-6-phosphate isomerase